MHQPTHSCYNVVYIYLHNTIVIAPLNQKNSKMTHAHNTTIVATTTTIFRWNSPVLYICGSLTLMLCVIACALMTLTCSYTKSYTSSNSPANIRDEVNPSSPEFDGQLSQETEAKIVVVMAGDINPSCLAKLVPSGTPYLHQNA
ncbi:putative protein glutamine dumper [Helianthus annuus]|nr:putative protein glutamine dumper [Helianthus annuus]KAJ0564237.1 putative protein glutamine dumper [Helianthus annuus]KAJ0729562.1 putative protein glutamine dumper [Helianthus annuus]